MRDTSWNKRRVRGARRWIAGSSAAVVTLAAGPVAAAEMAGAKHIKDMVGCFEVTYRYIEDGEHDFFSDQYGLDDSVTLVNEITSRSQNAITITNYAIGPDGDRRPHWHMVWVNLGDEKKWRQTIWSRGQGSKDREYRYSCQGAWQGNKWVCDAGQAPKPFRDDGAPFGFSRDDYSQLDRHNTILVTPHGWAMTQQNRKLTKAGEVVSHETGWILYDKQPAKACADSA